MDSVFNVTEVSGSSTESWERAARNALDMAAQTLDGPLSAQVLQQDVQIDGDGQTVFTVTLAVSSRTELIGDRPASAQKRVLIVANQTLASAGLEQLVHEMVAKEPAHFHVVVPQVSTSSLHADPSRLAESVSQAGVNEAYVTARREAENRLHTFRQLFDETHEATLTGEVVLGDPLQAVRNVMARSHFDEIIVSTLPAGVSKWLRMDLPHRIERSVDVPVTSLVQDLAGAS